MTITIPPLLSQARQAADRPERRRWLSALPMTVEEAATEWELELGEPYLPGGHCAWVAPARDRDGNELVLKVGWRHLEAEHEAEALRVWDGDGAVRCVAARTSADANVLLLERCVPGAQLKHSMTERDQDVIVARLMRRLWAPRLPPDHCFAALQTMCDDWADGFERRLGAGGQGFDQGLAREAIALFRELPQSADQEVLLCTDLHAENILSARREPWLVIDPKPFVGDPAYDPVQHMLNCRQRLADDPGGMAERLASLLELDPVRVKLWLFARCAQESPADPEMGRVALRLAP